MEDYEIATIVIAILMLGVFALKYKFECDEDARENSFDMQLLKQSNVLTQDGKIYRLNRLKYLFKYFTQSMETETTYENRVYVYANKEIISIQGGNRINYWFDLDRFITYSKNNSFDFEPYVKYFK